MIHPAPQIGSSPGIMRHVTTGIATGVGFIELPRVVVWIPVVVVGVADELVFVVLVVVVFAAELVFVVLVVVVLACELVFVVLVVVVGFDVGSAVVCRVDGEVW